VIETVGVHCPSYTFHQDSQFCDLAAAVEGWMSFDVYWIGYKDRVGVQKQKLLATVQ
jgi:hypothetical protein